MVAVGVRPSTAARYEQIVRLHLAPALGRLPLAKLEPKHLEAHYRVKLQEGFAPRTVVHFHRVLHGALGHALRQGLVTRNICDVVDPPRATRPELRVFTADQARRLLDTAAGDPLEALYVLALTTGMRRGELLGLKWADVDLTLGSLQVRRTVQRLKGRGIVESEPKSAQGRRRLSLSPLAVIALRQHRARQVEARLAAGSAWDDHDLVFANTFGRPGSHSL